MLLFQDLVIGSEAPLQKWSGAWCSNNKKLSLTKLKNDKDIDISFCEDQPVSKHFVIGKKLGVTGTPAIFSFDGRLFPGYLSPEELLIKIKIIELCQIKIFLMHKNYLHIFLAK